MATTSYKPATDDYSIEDYGVDGEQYFPGVGTAYTDWDSAFTGIGETLREAIEDALENAAQGDIDTTDIDPLAGFDSGTLDAPLHAATDECQADNEFCDHHHYAVLFIRGT